MKGKYMPSVRTNGLHFAFRNYNVWLVCETLMCVGKLMIRTFFLS